MSVVVRHEILELIKSGELKFSPALDSLQVRPHAVDLRLGTTFRVPRRTFNDNNKAGGRSAVALDYTTINNGHFAIYEEVKLKAGQYFDILPGEWVMGFTMEKINIVSPTLMAVLYPRSSVNRRGLAVDLTGIIDSGYKGNLMIPIHNTTSMQIIRIYPGERICQVIFERLEQPVREGYAGRYHGSKSYKPENSIREIELIRSGKFKDIKHEFKLVT